MQHRTPSRRHRGAAALVGILAACAATPNRAPGERASAPRESAPTESAVARAPSADDGAAAETAPLARGAVSAPARRDVVARVAGQPVFAADLLAQWMHRDSDGLRGHLESLVFSRLVVAEAARLGIELDRAMVDTRYEEGLARLQADLEKSEQGLTIDRYVRERLGLDPARYRRDLLRDLEVDLLAERCVRAWLSACERAEVRVIVVAKREDLDIVEAALAAGRDFAEVARTHSTHDSKEDGGRIPPVVRSDSGLARLAFATGVGEVGGPIFEEGSYLLLQVTARPKPVEGDWSEIGTAVEASLAAQPIEDPEYWQWKRAMQEQYEVDLAPLLELIDSGPEARTSGTGE